MKNRAKKRWGLTISLLLFVFVVMMMALLLSGTIVILLYKAKLLEVGIDMPKQGIEILLLKIVLVMMVFSILLGTMLAMFLSKKALKPIRKVIEATKLIAEGNFTAQVEIKGIYELEELSNSFNKMAHELSSIETLRKDFINNFSHEFKTPIVSMRGFAKLLKKGNLNKEDKQEYLDIIIAESERLAQLSTNVLNLSKYENIEIVTDNSPFRLDEQIRRAIVMMEPKWSAKDIYMRIDMEKVVFYGNEGLTQQIWLNLLDNAIKYSNSGGVIIINLSTLNGHIIFFIEDNGEGIDEQTKERIFDKFYQGDTSHTQKGNGLGLTIAKRITELYDGNIEVQSQIGRGSVFTLTLPSKEERNFC